MKRDRLDTMEGEGRRRTGRWMESVYKRRDTRNRAMKKKKGGGYVRKKA